MDWRLAARSAFVMGFIVLAVHLLPQFLWSRLTRRLARVRAGAPAPVPPQSVVRAVDRASRVIPGGTNCLVRALTARALLAHHGLESELVLGVARHTSGAVSGHAWLKYQNKTLVGAREEREYAAMPDLAGRV
jgi:hypothetical protein